MNIFTPEFYSYLKEKPGATDSLLLLYRNGNEKAGEIIKYLIGTSPLSYIKVNAKNNHKILHQNFLRGSATYNLTWSDFEINDLNKENILLNLILKHYSRKK